VGAILFPVELGVGYLIKMAKIGRAKCLAGKKLYHRGQGQKSVNRLPRVCAERK